MAEVVVISPDSPTPASSGEVQAAEQNTTAASSMLDLAREVGEMRARLERAESDAAEAKREAAWARESASSAQSAVVRLESEPERDEDDAESESEPDDGATLVVTDLPPVEAQPAPQSTAPRSFLMRLLLGK